MSNPTGHPEDDDGVTLGGAEYDGGGRYKGQPDDGGTLVAGMKPD
ncbi:MAG: hypothetical protein ACMUIM_09645 [bacterium]